MLPRFFKNPVFKHFKISTCHGNGYSECFQNPNFQLLQTANSPTFDFNFSRQTCYPIIEEPFLELSFSSMFAVTQMFKIWYNSINEPCITASIHFDKITFLQLVLQWDRTLLPKRGSIPWSCYLLWRPCMIILWPIDGEYETPWPYHGKIKSQTGDFFHVFYI